MRTLDPLKRRAFGWHLAASVLLTAAVAALIVLSWFPPPFTLAAGALTGLLIVVAVDLCLGPALTLLLIHSSKSRRENLLDATVIAALQLSALLFGLWQVYLARPVAAVFWQDSFYLVKAHDYLQRYGEVPDLSRFSQERLPLVYARYPLLLPELRQLEQAIGQGLVPYEQLSLYRPLADGLAAMAKSPVDIRILLAKYAELQPQLDQIADRVTQQQLIYSRLHSEYGVYLLVFDQKAKLVGLVALSSAPRE